MKVTAQGDPIEYECSGPAEACQLYRHDMSKALIGVVTHRTDHQRAKEAYREASALREQLATAHETLGTCKALLHELDASGNYPHSSTAIGLVLMAIDKALK